MPSRTAIAAILAATLAAAPALAQSWQARETAGVGLHLYRPAAQGRIGTGRGLLVALHGCIQTNEDLRDHGNFAAAAEAHGLAIALPRVPDGGGFWGCWDYYGTQHTRTNRHNGPLLRLVAALLADASLGLDPDQVYVAGLSSGATQAMVLGCLAPDVFAGVGVAAGPTVGTTSSQSGWVGTNEADAVALCRSLAGTQAARFATQLASVVAGTLDSTVALGYAPLNLDVYAGIYRAGGPPLATSTFDVAQLEGHQPEGRGTLRSDATGPRASLILADGMGHAWPAGSGPGRDTRWIAREGVDYPDYLARFFSENNRRVRREIPAPEVFELAATADDAALAIAATGRARGAVAIRAVRVMLDGAEGATASEVTPAADGSFSARFDALAPNATYTPAAIAIDADGRASPALRGAPVTLGAGPRNDAPRVTLESVGVIGDCVTATGRIEDDGPLASAELVVGGVREPFAPAAAFEATACGVPPGCWTAAVTAIDDAGAIDSASWPGVAIGPGACDGPDAGGPDARDAGADTSEPRDPGRGCGCASGDAALIASIAGSTALLRRRRRARA